MRPIVDGVPSPTRHREPTTEPEEDASAVVEVQNCPS